MKIIVDSNILISSLLKTESMMAGILFSAPQNFVFYSPEFLLEEIDKHQQKNLQTTGYSKNAYRSLLQNITSEIKFIQEGLIPEQFKQSAEKLISGIDINDQLYVSLALYIEGWIWTGDKKLISGLKKKGFHNCITTAELSILLKQKET